MELLIVLSIAGTLYFLPAIIAGARGHNSAFAIFLLNFFAGLTGIGWLWALIWAFTGNTRRNVRPVIVQVNQAAVVSAHAGDDAGRERRRASVRRQMTQWRGEIDEIERTHPSHAAERERIVGRLLADGARELRRIEGEGASREPAPARWDAPIVTPMKLARAVSKAGHAFYRGRAEAAPAGYLVLAGPALFDIAVAGCLHHQTELETLTGGRRDAPVYLHSFALIYAEPDNPHDANAVAVDVDGWRVGYIARADAAAFGAELAAIGGPGAFACAAVIENGWPDWRVSIDALRPLRLR